jgi:hypothetical protein
MLKTTLSIILITIVAVTASADIPDLEESTAEFYTYLGPYSLVLFVVPGGDGSNFQYASDGTSFQDGRIAVTLRTADGVPIANYPFEDIWLDTVDDGLVACNIWMFPDSNTDVNGMTLFSEPLNASGTSQGGTIVKISGDPLGEVIALHYNSPDYDASGEVGLPDLTTFTNDYFGDYNFRSDFDYNLSIDLADLAKFTFAYGAVCGL